MASTIRIGYRVGAGELLEARTTAAIALISAIGVAILGSLTIFFLREDIVHVYTTEANVSQLSATLLLFVVFFWYSMPANQPALECCGAIKTPGLLFIALLCFWLIGLPIGCILGFGLVSNPMEVFGFWIGLACGVISAAIGLSYRVWSTSANTDRIRLLSQK